MQPGALIASGRDADIFELGDGLALRSARDGRSIEHEARVMQLVADHGYPVPSVHDVRAQGSEIVMDRVDGPLMADAITRRPWALARYASLLADLHDQLHEIAAPDWLRQWPDAGDRVVHLDLHPLNVLMSPSGPVVIDWANAARGEGLSDVGTTYALLTCPHMPGPRALQIAVQPLRVVLARRFTRRYRGAALDEHIATAAERKMLDPNMAPDEVEALRRLARRMRRRIR
ncbi:MAG: RIO1 family regulatory kinase/ATPase domain-containing protein [Acidimicrobiia bacterium]